MYVLRHVPPDRRTDARGLTLHETFIRMMGLTARSYAFTRTARRMHLLMTDPMPGVDFCSDATRDPAARDEIKLKVCVHGLGQFRVMPDAEYARVVLGEEMAVE